MTFAESTFSFMFHPPSLPATILAYPDNSKGDGLSRRAFIRIPLFFDPSPLVLQGLSEMG